MIILPKSNDTDLRQLLYDVQEGKIQLPEFQRDWTWDDNRIRGIIASLSQGYPMGAIMQLQYGNPDIKFKYRTITGVENKNATPEYLVLDGQQRLTSIYQSTYSNQVVATKTDKGKSIKRFYYLDMNKCLDDNEDRLDAVVSVPEDRKIKANFDRDIIMDLSTRELEYQLKMFPINIIYDNTQLTRLLTLQTRLSAAYKGIMALLYKADCRDFMDNSKMNLVNSVILSPDIHHIFPEAYCQKVGIKRQKYNSIVNKTPILPPTNRSIGGDSPSKYIQTILNKVDGLTENELKDRIESHMINFEYLKQNDFDNYFIDRAKKLLNLIENAMGKNVSDRGSDDTIEQFGKSLI